MLQKSKKLMALILCVLMCVSMLSAFVLPVVSAAEDTEENAYAAINATIIEGTDILLPGSKVIFVDSKFGTGTFDYTYGDGENWGDGKTYRLTLGVNAFTALATAVHYLEDTWNANTTTLASYTGPDTIILAPGTYGVDNFQNQKSPTFNLPIDPETGKTVVNPAYTDLFTYSILGPQAGKSPVTDEIDNANPAPQNGRGLDTTKEAVSTSTIWSPRNGQLILDGISFKSNANFYRNSYSEDYPYTSTVVKNGYQEISSDKYAPFRYSLNYMSTNFELHNYYIKYKQAADYDNDDWYMSADRFVMDNVYDDMTEVTYSDTQYGQPYMMRIHPQPYDRIRDGWLGEGVEKAANYIFDGITLNNHKSAHWIRFYLDASTTVNKETVYYYADQPADSINVTFNECTFYNVGDYMRTTYATQKDENGKNVRYLKDPTTISQSGGMTDTISFQNDWAFPAASGALNFNFTNNIIEYTKEGLSDGYDHTTGLYNKPKTSGSGLINLHSNNAADLSNNKCKHDFYFKNNTMIMPDMVFSSPITLFNKIPQFVDASSMLVKDKDGNVLTYATGGSYSDGGKDNAFDSYAGDDFAGGIVEMFSIKDGADMAVTSYVTPFLTNNAAAPTATIKVLPYAAEKVHAAEELFAFRGDKVKFEALYDASGNELTEAKPSELDGAKLIASYKGKTTLCTVTYTIHVAGEKDIAFVDPSNSITSYEWNGKTYTLDSTNRAKDMTAAANLKRSVWVLLPGAHTASGGKGDRIDDMQVIIAGPGFGVSPLNEDMTLSSNRGVTGSGTKYTPDLTKEAVLTGTTTVYYSNTSLAIDGVVFDDYKVAMSDAKYYHAWSAGGGDVATTVKNVIYVSLGEHGFDGLSSGAELTESNNKRSLYMKDTFIVSDGDTKNLVSSGLYNIELNHIYATGGVGELIRTRMPSGKQLRLSPMACGLKITNSTIENWGTATGNWIYTNYIDYGLAPTWGLSADCFGEYFPEGIHQTFDNNTFINIMKSGCAEVGYALRLGVPCDMDNATLTFTNNKVLEDTLTDKPFIHTCYTGKSGYYGSVEIEGNAFVNFTQPIKLEQGNKEKAAVANLDKNYFAVTATGKELPHTITADPAAYVTKSDWYYMDRALTVKDTEFGFDLSEIAGGYDVVTLNDFTVDAKLLCGTTDYTTDGIKGIEGVEIVGVYADADCTTPITGSVTATTYYIKAKVKTVEMVYKMTTTVAAAHSWSEYEITLKETCEDPGEEAKTCALCEGVEKRVRDALGHVQGQPVYVEATCDEDASKTISCLRCHEIISQEIFAGSALGHHWDEEWVVIVVGDCTHDKVSQRHCEREGCDAIDELVETAPGHAWGDWMITKEAECTLNGEQTRVCDACATSETLPVTAPGHKHKEVTVEPTCAVEGKTEYICSECGHVDETLTIILMPTYDHAWGNVIHTAATCKKTGVDQRFCTVCNGVDQATRVELAVDATAHVFAADDSDWVVVNSGNCVEPAVKQRLCQECGYTHVVEDYTNVTGEHKNTAVITPATPTQTGKIENHCSVCGNIELVKLLARDTALTDLDEEAWYFDYVTKANAYGIIKGYPDSTFKPNNAVSRAEAVIMIARVAGVDTSDYSTAKFTDVGKKSWYNGAIAWAEQNLIVSGRSETIFAPNAKITRQELCTILVRYADFAGVEMEEINAKAAFADDAKIAKWAKSSVYRCQMAGIVSGRPGNNFAPTSTASRAETAKILVTFLEDYVIGEE